MFFLCLLCTRCVHIELCPTGLVKDADTQNPLKDVIVFQTLCRYCLLPPNPGGNSCEYIGYKEALTDSEGRYNLTSSFYLMPPLMCYTSEPDITFFKFGYFMNYRSDEKKGNFQVLYKMNHYLNYLPHKSGYYIDNVFEEKSQLLNKVNLEKMKQLYLSKRAGELGVFFRSQGRKFTKIYSTYALDINSNLSTNRFVFVFDETENEWVCIDSRGKIINLKNRTAVDGGKISEELKTYLDYNNISNNGESICLFNRLNCSSSSSICLNNKFNCLTTNDIPETKEDDSLKYSKFVYSSRTKDNLNNYFVVTKTLKFWHIYKNSNDKLEKILSFPIEINIVGLVANGNDFFLAFKNEGIRKYKAIIGVNNVSFREDEQYFLNSSRIGKLNINSISSGSAVNMNAIYVTTGDDKIYRFSAEDGTPDYIINPTNFD